MKQRAKQLICTLLMAVMVMGYLLPLSAEASTDCPWITNCEQLTLRINAENRVDSDGGISKVTTENKCDDKNCKDCVGQQNKVCNERINAVSSSRSRQAACNHTYAYVTTKAATCTQDGRQTYQCTKCGLVNTQAPGKTIPKLGHNMKRVTTKQPTCGATGTYVTKCTRCGVGDPNGNGSIAATGNHNWTLKSTTAATCVADGKKVFKCSVCGQSKTETLAKLGHSWNMSSANCTTAKKCTRCGTIGQNALGHSYQTIITKDATCGAQGTYTTKCIRCGASGSGGYIAPTGNHKWNRNESSCTEAKKCTVCGTVAEAAKGHTWNLSSPNCTTDKKCTRCGTVSQKALGHSWNLSSPNCTTDKKCTRCGSIAQKALGHDYKTVTTKNPTCGAQGTYVIQCTRCNAQNGSGYINPTGNHVWNRNAATCLEAKKCTVCGTVGEAAKGHIWNASAATCMTDKKCTVCGTVGEKATGHTWNISEATCLTDQKCTKCGTIGQSALGHDYRQVITKEATCGTPGIIESKCTRCGVGNPNGNGTIQPTGDHQWNCESSSCWEAKICTVCGIVDEPMKEHTWVLEQSERTNHSTDGYDLYRCSVCSATKEIDHNFEWVCLEPYNCVSISVLYMCTNPECGHVIDGSVIQNYAGHDFMEANSDKCEHECRRCGYVEECHSWTDVTKVDEHECYSYRTRTCEKCGLELPIKEDIQEYHIWTEEIIPSDTLECCSFGFKTCEKCGLKAQEYEEYHIPCDSTWKIDHIEVSAGETCDVGRVWRICPYCQGEYIDENTVGGPHKLVGGKCSYCGYEDEHYLDAFILYGDEIITTVNGNGINLEGHTEALLKNFEGFGAVKAERKKYDQLYSDDDLLDYIDSVRCFAYSGHGDSAGGGTLAFNGAGEGFGRESLYGRDLSNLDIVALPICYSAFGTNNSEGVEKYKNSIAYTFCEQGAKTVVGCFISMDDNFCGVWEEEFFTYYPHIIQNSKDIENPVRREAYVQEYTRDLTKRVTCSVVARYTQEEYSKQVVIFHRDGNTVVCETVNEIRNADPNNSFSLDGFDNLLDNMVNVYNQSQ